MGSKKNFQFTPSPNTKFMVRDNGQQFGPYSIQELQEYAQKGVLKMYTEVWTSGMPRWMRVGNIPALVQLLNAPQQSTSVTSSSNPDRENDSTKYSILINNQQSGPYSINQLQDFARNGNINADTLVWTQGMGQWEKAGNIKELSFMFAPFVPPSRPLSAPQPPIPPQQNLSDNNSQTKTESYPQELLSLLKEYLTDGIISAKERQVLLKKAESLGIDVNEFDLYIDAQQQKEDQAVEEATRKKRGKTCPFCGGTVPQLTDKCPHCGETITPEASVELQEIFDKLEEALINYKSGKDIAKNKAVVERYVRKAKMYYDNNPKVQKLLAEVQNESEKASIDAKKNARKNLYKENRKWILIGSAFLLLLLIIGIVNFFTPKTPEEMLEESTELVKKGKVEEASKILIKFVPPEGVSIFDYIEKYDAFYLTAIKGFIKNKDYEGAEELALAWRSKNDYNWDDSSCYEYLKNLTKKGIYDFSSIKEKYDEDFEFGYNSQNTRNNDGDKEEDSW